MNKISPNITNKTNIVETPILTVEEVGDWLNLPTGLQIKNKDMIEGLIKTVTEVVENYTWLSLRRTTFEADFKLDYNYFNSFLTSDLKLSLERSPIIKLEDITKIEYLNENGVYEEFVKGALSSEGLYENVTESKEQREWASIYFDETIPYDCRYNAYKIKVTFIAGFTIDTDPVTDIPQSLKQAMLIIIASYYTNRGDCSDKGCSLNGFAVPCSAKSILDQYSLANTIVGSSYNISETCGYW